MSLNAADRMLILPVVEPINREEAPVVRQLNSFYTSNCERVIIQLDLAYVEKGGV